MAPSSPWSQPCSVRVVRVEYSQSDEAFTKNKLELKGVGKIFGGWGGHTDCKGQS